VVTLTLWMIVVTPIPTACLWPGLLLPNTMLSFIAEGSKFLLFDIALCHKEVWFPSGVDSLPEIADRCQLGSSAFYGIAAGILHLTALVCVCLKSPKKRKIDPSYGIYPTSSETSIDRSYVFRNDYRDDGRKNASLAQDPSLLDEDIYTEGPSPANNSLVLKTIQDGFPITNGQQEYTSQDDSSDPIVDEPSTSITRSKFTFPNNSSSNSSTIPVIESPTTSTVAIPPPRISESRIAVLSKFDLSCSTNNNTYTINNNNGVAETISQQQMIDDLLTELDTSLADERYD
jgi:hypothetical protein